MAEMTPRERLLTAARRGVPDRVPRDIPFEGGLVPAIRAAIARERQDCDPGKLNLTEYFRCDPRWVGPDPERRPTDFSRYFDGPGVEWDHWGRGRKWDDTRHYAEYLYPLKDVETVAGFAEYPWPDLLEDHRYEGMADRVRAYHQEGFAVLGGPSEFFEIAWQLRSMERLMEDMLLNPELARACLDPILERNVRFARECARAGVDILYLGDDVAMQNGLMMSVETWREYLGPAMKAVIDAAREIKPDILVWYHSDGKITDLVPDLIRVGLDILNPVQPECVDAAFLKQTYGDRLAFWAGLGVQSVLPFGTPDEVREHVRLMIEVLGANGGYIVGPSHMLERDVSYENVKAMVQAIDDFGSYA